MSTIPDNLRALLERELDPGETVTWSASPSREVLWRLSKPARVSLTWFLSLVSISFLFLAVIYNINLLEPESGVSSPSIMLFILSGVSAAIIPTVWVATWIVHGRTARSTVYAITEYRAIVLQIAKDRTCTERDYRGDELIHLARIELPDGNGTLVFESARGAGATQQTASRHRFQGIHNVLQVERMLRERFGNS